MYTVYMIYVITYHALFAQSCINSVIFIFELNYNMFVYRGSELNELS